MLSIGETAPDFELPDQDRNRVSWASLRGKPVVVFFYPRADTPGCTKEACAFRDARADLTAAGAVVIGISADTPKKQAAFASKYELQIPLLADPERAVIEPWGVWAEKKMYGKTSFGIVRTTFLFDALGRVVHVWEKVKVDGHVEAVLERLRSAGAAGTS